MWTTEGLNNESDVEQKLIFPLLTSALPSGLGLPASVVLTKVNIKRLLIGKGADAKLYYPDYLVVIAGFPIVVAEAKGPTESVEEGYRQARLYAAELNALYAHDFNPTQYVIATNGIEIWFGHSDAAEPLFKEQCSSLGPYSQAIATLVGQIGWLNLQAISKRLAQTVRPSGFFKPRRLLGGQGLQNEEVGHNTFGDTLTSAILPIFNPGTVEERKHIAVNGYIPSRRRERYVDPIDRVIRAAKPPSEVHATGFEDSSRPTELISKMKQLKALEHKVLLLIGSVGSGKSTFIDHLKEVALPKDLIDATVWCRFNMNPAPVSANEIYTWLRRQLMDECKASLPQLDFDDIDVIKRVLGVEISKFTKGVGKLFESQPEVYAIKLGEHIQELQRDEQLLANAFVRFSCGERQRLCIVVLDNCDKKNRDEQLLMFEAAQWLQKEFRCLVILPLRDETYDNHRDQPPLDTALKDLVFRIEPPMFQQVLVSRVQLALKALDSDSANKLRFSLPNGFHVEYPPSDQAFFLTAILRSLFEHDRFARRMIVGLSGRNMRRALEIFLEFCTSGYIGEDQIFKIRQSKGDYAIPFHQVATVLLRMNRRFYDSDHSYINNIFSANSDDARPSFFARFLILRWLRERFSESGTSGFKGYFRKNDAKIALMPYGFTPDVLDREFNNLLSARCVIAEHLRTDSVSDEDLIRLGPAGFVHLDLIGNINYLAAVAEDTFFEDRYQAERIVTRIRGLESHLHVKTAVDNAEELVGYLESIWKRMTPPNGTFVENDLLRGFSGFSEARETLVRVAKSHSGDPWFDADRRLARRSKHEVVVLNVVDFGCFVEFGDSLVGLLHKSNYQGMKPDSGDRLEVEIIWVDVIQKKMNLKLIRIVEEDVGDLFTGLAEADK